MNVGCALQQARRLLEDAAVPASRLTAEVLLARALDRERTYLYSHPEAELGENARVHYERYLDERLRGVPTQYITGRQEFYGREFRVTPAVLIPRPETEFVVETVLSLPRPRRVLDVGCGSGAIAVTLSLELQTPVWASDLSPAALDVAAANAQRLGAAVHFAACDVTAAFANASFDLIASNPPYVARGEQDGLQREVRDHEPHLALFAGPTGFEIYERLVADSPRVLSPSGWLVMELGYRSLDGVRALLGAAWEEVRVQDDLAGIPRALAARLRA